MGARARSTSGSGAREREDEALLQFFSRVGTVAVCGPGLHHCNRMVEEACSIEKRVVGRADDPDIRQRGSAIFVDEVADDDLEGIFRPARMDASAARIELLAVDPNPLAALANRDLVFGDSLARDRRDVLGIVEKRDFIALRA